VSSAGRDSELRVRRFSVEEDGEGRAAFLVVGPDGRPVPDAAEFARWLALRDRTAYTQRSYALGVAHFFDWLVEASWPLVSVDRTVVASYIDEFKRGAKGGAVRVDRARVGRVDRRTRKPAPALERKPTTVNHRLSVLASFFSFLIDRDATRGAGPWLGRENPVPLASSAMQGSHGLPGRDAPRRGRRGELRQRVPRMLPRTLEPGLAEELVEAARSWRDKALLVLLWRTGQRIGDWSETHGRHGLLGMALCDLERLGGTVTVRLKGARGEHRVPVAGEFWPLFSRYLAEERGFGAPGDAAWLARGGRPLSYLTFRSALRYVGGKVGAQVNAHMFRHTLAQALVETCGLKVAQEVLGHSHLSTTADAYARLDQAALVRALAAANAAQDAGTGLSMREPALPRPVRARVDERAFVFPYDELTIAELDAIAADSPDPEERCS
jgi:integrase/recombinase XerD